MENQEKTPIYEALLHHRDKKTDSYHVPGHKQGANFLDHKDHLFQSILQIDQTEITGLDDLHHPSGVIARAEHLAAEAFGAEKTFYLVGGSTAGNIASILAMCLPGDKVILQRSCHQSVFHGCMLAGVSPTYWKDTYHSDVGFERPLDLDWLAEQCQREKITLVVVTSPSYYGMIQPIREIADICHRFDVALLVDEAHGAHFGFHPDLPDSALSQGADLVVQSTHKMLGSMTMSSMLHVGSNQVRINDLERQLRIVQSSSPSYPLLASLDLARKQIAVNGFHLFERLLTEIDQFKRDTFPYCKWVQELSLHHLKCQDPCKMVIASHGQISGFEMQTFLEDKGIYTELADDRRVLFCFSLAHPEGSLIRLRKAFLDLDCWLNSGENRLLERDFITLRLPSTAEFVLSFQNIRKHRHERLRLEEAIDGIITEPIVPYPPGIPVLLPGERLTCEWMEYLRDADRAGYQIRGLYRNQLTSEVSVNIVKNRFMD
ncbi:aminotransferase class I/II-fold pyridoxal phosphate-dependent enzyme [Thermoactinomyces sp. DSM 45892]|uniref:aminotransferase class I/II-fold pyridoxal phosphate-dependent enzyme n=1 Tax=Thermoactinomyces sp. DSM 45892 TaxID=1882753 RepID=UPI0008976CC7|nr:aminotransferase class I/II-fold pyridoxal phosphate-dependent enzyme [Thermoactinomyces sp. DSM 45892]SDY95792.1 lysine decarboxylase [Thermoactinomyces sp. DSM 45892]